MKHDHVADARCPGKTALLRRLYCVERGDWPDLKSQPEAVTDFLPEQHNQRGREANHPGSDAVDQPRRLPRTLPRFVEKGPQVAPLIKALRPWGEEER